MVDLIDISQGALLISLNTLADIAKIAQKFEKMEIS
jgi:hypothetical protein